MKNTNDAIGRRTAMARSGSVFSAADTLSYLYNDRSEVTGANSNAAGSLYHYAYSFDNIGNRLTANLAGTPWTYTANNLNQYSAFTKNQIAETPSYDDDGNMLTRDGWVQTWNAENRLIKAEKGTAKLEFAYDYMGRRIFRKVYSSGTLTQHTRFVYDGYKLMEELDALNNNAVLRRYAWSPVGLDVPVSVYDAVANSTCYYHTDANKNITELTNASGSVVAHYEYSPFGKVVVSTGTYANINPFRFSSEYHDDETGLVYYNYRYYSPELGRWLSRDPIEEEGGVNLYGMVGNHLINLYDQLGWLWPFNGKIYKKWGGGNYSAGINTPENFVLPPYQSTIPGEDSLDECFKQHDYCYQKCEQNNSSLQCTQLCKSKCDFISIPCQLMAGVKNPLTIQSIGAPIGSLILGTLGEVRFVKSGVFFTYESAVTTIQ